MSCGFCEQARAECILQSPMFVLYQCHVIANCFPRHSKAKRPPPPILGRVSACTASAILMGKKGKKKNNSCTARQGLQPRYKSSSTESWMCGLMARTGGRGVQCWIGLNDDELHHQTYQIDPNCHCNVCLQDECILAAFRQPNMPCEKLSKPCSLQISSKGV